MHRLPPFPSLRACLHSLAPLAVQAPLLAPALLAPNPATAQAIDDWSTAPLAIPADPGGAPAAAGAAEPSPVLQAPAELRRPQAPLLPGQESPLPPRVTPSVRIAPGAGVRPRPAPLPSRPPVVAPAPLRLPAAPSRPPAAARPTPGVTPPLSTLPKPPGPSEAELARLRAQLRQQARPAARPPVPSFLETLPPGTIRPLPGEVLPGSQMPGGAAPGAVPRESLPGLPRPPLPPQAVPPPPWADRKPARPLQNTPLAWLLLGLGLGGGGVFLLQERRRRPPQSDPLGSLGIRVLPRPDPGEQSLRPADRAAAAPLE
ncbi:MAG: hypothetical protein ACK55D_06715 [Synechococcaceae cyanobacterium]